MRSALLAGGWCMAPLVALAAITLALVLERALALLLPRTDAEALLERVSTALRTFDLPLALRSTGRSEGPAARVVRAGLLLAQEERTAVSAALALAVEVEARVYFQRIGALSAVAKVATLLGLLGTLTGQVVSFACFGPGVCTDVECRTTRLAEGIGEAMHCTAAGLGIALVALAAHGFFFARARELEGELDWLAHGTLALLDELRAGRHTHAS